MTENHTTTLIIGAGITGIGAAYHLGKSGIPYVVLEGNDDVGGVWHTQRWHGARCDSDFVKYSFSFRPYVSAHCLHSRADIQGYLRAVAEEFGIVERTRFGARVKSASFDSARALWTVETDQGTFTSRFLVNGNGYFSEPHIPRFPQADTFAGELIHTFQLDGERRFEGKDVLLVGSGSTAICCAPELAKVSGSLTMLQRSPSYIYEIDNRATPFMRACQALYNRGLDFPIKLLRGYLQARDDLVFLGFRAFPGLARWIFRRHWLGTVSEEELRRNFTPRYAPWEQRIPVAIGLKEAVRTGRVAIQTGEIAHFTPTGVVLKDGTEKKCDVCVLATGFELNFVKFDLCVDGTPVDMAGINFFKGVMLGGVPNYFQPVGVFHSAWTQRSEAVTRFAIRIMKHMAAKGLRTVSVDRKGVQYVPTITPNYITRRFSAMPRLYGSFEIPSVDNLFCYRFQPRSFRFG